ncbi:alpha-ribazole transporter [Natranaerovirga hydrolytica]|uniref:Alpha-ribazole transporter n=1 Tax=Natranaerovirga hydrolytica TaxID=680378 RepID=A0A4R1N3J3_9FIRM|nr:ECF transporter S component [Natranaerovirga hydrolytica]TCK98624.1 alpha-ribazole transporter [Natranaerovirga hydrolytica]
MSKNKTNQLVYLGVLIALSFIGAQLKIQGSIAFDSMPAFLGAILISPTIGGIVGFFGHLLTSLSSGFPMTLPIHLVVAIVMAVTCFLFGYITNKLNLYIAIIIATLLNGPVALAISAYTMTLMGYEYAGMAVFTAMFVPLTIASFVNIVIAGILHSIIKSPSVRKN